MKNNILILNSIQPSLHFSQPKIGLKLAKNDTFFFFNKLFY